MSERWPPPTDPTTFESLCADLWGSVWGQAAHKNGRMGQPQAGVDIFGKSGDRWIGIQCKQKDQLLRTKLTPPELAEEVAAARNFVPPLSRFIIATTGPSDVHVQEAARSLTEKHVKQGLFTVEVWSWVEIWAELNRRPGLLQTIGPVYWPRLFLLAEQKGQAHAEQIVRAIQSPLLPCGVFLTLRVEATDEDLSRVYGDQAGFHNLPRPLTPTDGRHFLKGFYLDVRDSHVLAAGFFRLDHPEYNTLHRSVKHTISRFDPARCKKPLSENEPLFLAPHLTLEFYRGGQAMTDVPTLVLRSDATSVAPVSSCALDNTVLVDYVLPQLSVTPADLVGLSVSDLRGSFLRVTFDFLYIKPIIFLPEQSWPRLHNLQLVMGGARHLLACSLDDLANQITRPNPKPYAFGDAVMPQIVFEWEVSPDRFEKQLSMLVTSATAPKIG